MFEQTVGATSKNVEVTDHALGKTLDGADNPVVCRLADYQGGR